jgi:hypothetical protein
MADIAAVAQVVGSVGMFGVIWMVQVAHYPLMRFVPRAQFADFEAAHSARTIPLDRSASWYVSAEARLIATHIISFQTPAGGWSKNTDYTDHLRQPGESFAHDSGSLFLKPGDNDLPHDARWSYIGTFDNDATTTELRYLAKVAARDPATAVDQHALAALRHLGATQTQAAGLEDVHRLRARAHGLKVRAQFTDSADIGRDLGGDMVHDHTDM